MNKRYLIFHKIILLIFIFLSGHNNAFTQSPNYTANSQMIPYSGPFQYGTNMGYYPGWTDGQLGDLAIGNPALNIPGIGATSLRPGLFEHYLEQYGYSVNIPWFQHYESLGLQDHTMFIGYPSPDHRDPAFHCANSQSTVFDNMYLPIWDNGENGTPVNDDNYYALFLYKMVTEYQPYIKFWEIWNEPDLDFSPNGMGWRSAGDPMGSWWDTNPDPCDIQLAAPIFYYNRLLRISYEVIKSIDPDAYVTVGGLGFPSFLDAMMRNTDNPVDGSVTADYPLKAGAYFDVLSFHSYPHINGSLLIWDPINGITGYKRHSDAAIKGITEDLNEFKAVMENYGYEGNTYPEKQVIMTESSIPRKKFGDYIGSEEAARNYAIKLPVELQKEGVLNFYFYDLGEKENFNNAIYPFQVTGFYEKLVGANFNTVKRTDSGIGYKTVSDLLFEKKYDPVQTAALNLPTTVDGAAFKDVNGQFTYALWAICQTDDTEASTAIYSFPSSFNFTNLESKAWNYALTNQQDIIGAQNITLTGSPIFLTASNQQISFACPADISMTVNSNQNGAIINWTPPTASTLCNDPTINITQTGGLTNGSFFPVGTTTITYQVSDNCGNIETCNFIVTIDQSPPPVITCNNGQHELNVTIIGNGSVDIEFINPSGATQTCSNGTCTYCVDANTLVKFVGVPNPGETFTGWTGGGCSGNNVCWKTISWETNITATFSENLATNIQVSATPTDASCNGDSDGNIIINLSGGAPNYTYAWSNGATTSQLNNVSAGSYVVTVTDTNGITASATATVGQPAALVSLIANQNDISCIGTSDGSATVAASGGTPPYTYSWSNSNLTTTTNNLSIGNYTVTITDNNGCSATASATIGAPSPLSISTTSADASCVGNSDGSATTSVSGGNAPYTYAWSNGGNTSSITNSLSGSYIVNISDNNGCTISDTTTILNTNANAPTPDFSKNINALVVDFTDISTGNPDTWLWEFGDGETATTNTASHTYATAGTYLACLTASNGCGQNIACQNISVGIANNVNIMLEDVEGEAGTIVHIPVRIDNFENVVSFQHSFIITDTTKAAFVGTSNFITSLLGNPASFNVSDESINTVWLAVNGTPTSVIDGTALYYLDVLIKGEPTECVSIMLNEQNFPTEFVVVDNGNIVQIGSNFTSGEICTSPGVIISGKIRRENGDLIEEVNIFNNNIFTTTTGTTGSYELPSQSAGNSYLIEAHKDTNYVNGVTSFDLAIIQQHIVGNIPLGSPYQIIAADINHSETVTSFDLFLAQQVIVGLVDTFPDNESWRFIPADFVFPNPDSPFVSGFPEEITLNNLDTSSSNQDFIAIKVGDVNGTALPNNFDGGTSGFTRSTEGDFNFLVKKQNTNAEEFYVEFLAKDFQNISAFQFDLFFEKNNIEFLRVENTGLNTSHGVRLLEDGIITFIWYATQDFKKSIEDHTSLFRIYFKEKNNTITWDKNIRITHGITHPIAYHSSGEAMDIDLFFDKKIKDKKETGTIIVEQNQPNPFSKSSKIAFEMLIEDFVEVRFVDQLGNTIYSLEEVFSKGKHQLKMDKNDFGSTGVYYYIFTTSTNRVVKKMVIQ